MKVLTAICISLFFTTRLKAQIVVDAAKDELKITYGNTSAGY